MKSVRHRSKLNLHRETLRQLSATELDQAAGGTLTIITETVTLTNTIVQRTRFVGSQCQPTFVGCPQLTGGGLQGALTTGKP